MNILDQSTRTFESSLYNYTSMAQLGVDVRVGLEGTEDKQLYKHIELTLEMHQEKLVKINQDICTILAKTATPFILLEYPHANFANTEVFNFKGQNYDSGFHTHNHKLYQFANPKSKETIRLIKNLDKEFQKVTKLNNTASLRISLYEPQSRQNPISFLDRSRIRGHAQTDSELVATLLEIIRRISNEFLNSPIMAFVELLQQFSFKVELQKTEKFPEDLKRSVLSLLDFKEWVHKHNLGELISCKGDLTVQITLPKLLSIKIKGEASTIGHLLANFS